MLRNLITETLMANSKLIDRTHAVIDLLEDQGLSLEGNGWLDIEDDDGLECKIRSIVEGSLEPHAKALELLATLEDEGLSLIGNGWLDDDPETLAELTKRQ